MGQGARAGVRKGAGWDFFWPCRPCGGRETRFRTTRRTSDPSSLDPKGAPTVLASPQVPKAISQTFFLQERPRPRERRGSPVCCGPLHRLHQGLAASR